MNVKKRKESSRGKPAPLLGTMCDVPGAESAITSFEKPGQFLSCDWSVPGLTHVSSKAAASIKALKGPAEAKNRTKRQ